MDALIANMTYDNDEQVLGTLADKAEQAERYEDMVTVMRKYVTLTLAKGISLPKPKRNQLSVAYKNVVGAKRSAWRTLHVQTTQNDDSNAPKELAEKFKTIVEGELESTCLEAVGIIKKLAEACDKAVGNVTKPSSDEEKEEVEALIFYYKMLGDYYRYIAEFKKDKADSGNDYKKECEEAYKKAMKKAEDSLPETHPTRLGLALNFSVCYYEIIQNPEEACKLAKSAFDEAIEKLDTLNDSSYKDSTLIMQLLRDNLTLWTTQNDNPATDKDP